MNKSETVSVEFEELDIAGFGGRNTTGVQTGMT